MGCVPLGMAALVDGVGWNTTRPTRRRVWCRPSLLTAPGEQVTLLPAVGLILAGTKLSSVLQDASHLEVDLALERLSVSQRVTKSRSQPP